MTKIKLMKKLINYIIKDSTLYKLTKYSMGSNK